MEKNVHYYIMYNNKKLKTTRTQSQSREMDEQMWINYINGIVCNNSK